MFNQFLVRYPKGSLITELLTIKRGKYVVRALVQVEGVTLATGLAAADTVEMAEDQARSRALAFLDIFPLTGENKTGLAADSMPVPPTPVQGPQKTSFSPESLQAKPSPVLPEIPKIDAAPVSYSEPKPIDPSAHEKPLPLSSPVVGENENGAAPVSWDLNGLPFIENFNSHPDEEEMPTVDDLSDVETPTGMQPLPPIEHQPTDYPKVREQIPENQLHRTPSVTPVNGDKNPIEPRKPDTGTKPSSQSDNFAELMAKTNVEIKRLRWSNEEGRDYLGKTYDRRSRSGLTEQELLDFLLYLESLPTPTD